MPSILVHQALHGYNDGHRLISSSLTPDASDARLMLVMSDLSGPGMKPSDRGYLTGYPLEQSGRYVLARTWAAPEMPRPGCVWTHSLIIENADLAKLRSAQTLLNAFTRPSGLDDRSTFGSPISVPLQSEPKKIEPIERAELLLQALYTCPTQQVVCDAGEPFLDEQLVTAIWMQQWPRLRRTFGFCTLSGMDRSRKGVVLDLQFVPDKDHQLRSKFPNAVVADGATYSDELLPLLADLAYPPSSTLREFLKRTGGDVDGGRRAMLPLCKLHESLLERNPPDLASAVSALEALDSGGRRQARAIRMLITRQAIKVPGRMDDAVFEFLLNMMEQMSDPIEHAEIGRKIGIELWRRSPHRFHDALISEGALSNIASRAIVEMNLEQIISGLESNAEIANDISERRPDIMMLSAFWLIPGVSDQLAERISDQDAGIAAQALLAAGRVGPAEIIIGKADPTDLIRSLESIETNSDVVRGWLLALCRDPNKLAAVLASGEVKQITTVVNIARKTSPDDVPNSFGEDPWLVALRTASGLIDGADKDFLAAYFLCRALGWRSRSQAELLQYSYTRVHKAFEGQHFPRDTERLATSRLGRSSWFDWDNCSRLRETVTKKFVEQDLNPEIFGHLTDETPLVLSLIDEAALTKKGRLYLKRVYNALKYVDERGVRASTHDIDENSK